jgi:glycosyltransferase involved in cell wall biosynthesis
MDKMKVVHVSTSDIGGGAAIAAHRLHLAMLEQGIDSKMLVMTKLTDEKEVELARKGKLEKFIFSNFRKMMNKIPLINYNRKENIIFSTGNAGINISKHKYILETDVIYLHWIVGGFLSLRSLKKIAQLNKKIKWVLHDSWAFTGGCHVRYGCEKYQKSCGSCHMLNSKKEKDISKKIFNKKKKIYRNFKNLMIITPSKWLGECVKKSSLMKDFPVKVIPNVLDNHIFKPLDVKYCREILNLKNEKKYLLFGALDATKTSYKGWSYLKEALNILNANYPDLKNKVELLVFGASHSDDIEKLPFKTKFMGKIYDEYTLSLIYNSANVFVSPSLEDNLPSTVLESLHCGTPVVAFNIGGMPDMIEHKRNGYLANYKDTEDLANGIKWVLDNLNNVKIENSELERKNIIKKIISLHNS